MTFFNKKEDVLKIELTPHGRKLLSQGKLMPSYYAFLDDDVLYDVSQGGASENNSQSKQRILSETPYMKPQTNYKGIDSSKNDMSTKAEQVTFLQQKIGSNNTAEKRASGWNVTALLGEIDSSENALSGSNTATQPIPQLEMEINYTMSAGNAADLEIADQGFVFNREIPTAVKLDGSFVDVVPEQILLNIFERNGFFHGESHEIEVYLFEQDETKINRKLKFYNQETEVVNNMLVDKNKINTEELTNEFVEYYLDISTDKEIPEEDICNGLRRLKAKDIFLDIEVECPERDDLDINIYGTRVREEDLEDC